jgi:O-antigen/teichoic acid export membrane protein
MIQLMDVSTISFSTIKNAFHGDSLKARCARSGVILGIGAFIAKFLGFGSKVVLTRLLVPQDMGLMVMIISLTALFEVLTEVGIKQSVIQHKNGADPEYLNMAWWFQSLRAIGLYVVAFIVAPWLCEFYFSSRPEVLTRYSMEELTTLIRVAFLSILFNGFVSPRAHVLEKKFKFGRAVVITQGGFVLGAIVTIILAFLIRNVWAIVIGFAATGFTRCLMSYVLCPFMPRFAYHRESFQGLYRFAKGMLGLPVLTYIAYNIDVLVAGKLVSTLLIGFYGMALALAFAPRDLFSRIISPILLPAFAEKQNDREALCSAVLKITRISTLLLIPVTALAIICSKTILTFVFGTEYSAAAVPFSLLCVYVLLLIQYPAIKLFGLTGAAAVVLLASSAAMCVQVAVIRKTIGLNIFDYAVSWVPGLALAVPVLAVFVVVRGLTPDSPMVHLTVGVLLCIIVSVIGLLLFFKKYFDKPEQHKRVDTATVGLVGAEEAESA